MYGYFVVCYMQKRNLVTEHNDSIWAYLSFLVCMLQLSDKENLYI